MKKYYIIVGIIIILVLAGASFASGTPDKTIEERVTELESHVEILQGRLTSLEEAIIVQDATIHNLQSTVEAMGDRINILEDHKAVVEAETQRIEDAQEATRIKFEEKDPVILPHRLRDQAEE